MKLSTFKMLLQQGAQLQFELSNSQLIPAHFHITEIGTVQKNYIDCGGTLRNETKISFQLWYDNDTTHRLYSEKLLNIIRIAEEKIGLPDVEIEVEYQADTVGKYSLDVIEKHFFLKPTQTACLALDACGIPAQKEKLIMSEIIPSSCAPGSGCC